MIKGISEKRRLPRAGKIHLGVKLSGKNPCKSCAGKGKREGQPCGRCGGTGKSQYPSEVDYFVCPPEVSKIVGEKPRTLDIILPVEDPELCFPQALKRYGAGKGLKCRGDGDRAWEADEKTGEFREIECDYKDCAHYKSGECREVGNLMALLPGVGITNGIYQIDTGSYHSIVQINSDMDFIRSLVEARTGQPRISMIPLKLSREAKETHGSGRKEVHFCLRLKIEDETLKKLKPMALPQPQKYRLIPAKQQDIEEDLYPRRLVETIERPPERDDPEAGETPPARTAPHPAATRGPSRSDSPTPAGQETDPDVAPPLSPLPNEAGEENAGPGEMPPAGMDDLFMDKIGQAFKIANVPAERQKKYLDYYKDHLDLLLSWLDSWINWRDNGREGPAPKCLTIPTEPEQEKVHESARPAGQPKTTKATAASAGAGAKRSLF